MHPSHTFTSSAFTCRLQTWQEVKVIEPSWGDTSIFMGVVGVVVVGSAVGVLVGVVLVVMCAVVVTVGVVSAFVPVALVHSNLCCFQWAF